MHPVRTYWEYLDTKMSCFDSNKYSPTCELNCTNRRALLNVKTWSRWVPFDAKIKTIAKETDGFIAWKGHTSDYNCSSFFRCWKCFAEETATPPEKTAKLGEWPCTKIWTTSQLEREWMRLKPSKSRSVLLTGGAHLEKAHIYCCPFIWRSAMVKYNTYSEQRRAKIFISLA